MTHCELVLNEGLKLNRFVIIREKYHHNVNVYYNDLRNEKSVYLN